MLVSIAELGGVSLRVRDTIGGWWYVRSASRRDGAKVARRFIAGNPIDPPKRSPGGTAETPAVGQSFLRDSFTSLNERHPGDKSPGYSRWPRRGLQRLDDGVWGLQRLDDCVRPASVIPANAGIQKNAAWTPACAGVTIGTILLAIPWRNAQN